MYGAMLRFSLAPLLLLACDAALSPISGTAQAVPEDYRLLASSGASTLHEVVLPSTARYALGAPLVATLVGNRTEMGRAYATLLGDRTIATFTAFIEDIMPDPAVRAIFEEFADLLWERFAKPHVPTAFLEELEGMRLASPPGRLTVDQVSIRFNVLGNLPADKQNIITMLESELEKGMAPRVAALLNRVINTLDHCTWCKDGGRRLPTAPGCDAFAAWGSRTEGGRLFSSRNLDWQKDTGIGRNKLVTVFRPDDGAVPYATFGFASGFGALAGMNSAGLTVSEMNLDNALTTFDGPPFPLRLRMVLEVSRDLAHARGLWEATNNTDSMNFLIASSRERSALAIETIGGGFGAAPPYSTYSAFFTADDPVERDASCEVDAAHGGCGTGFPTTAPSGGRKLIGFPRPEVVWRTNHALHPRVMDTQEPLFNSTTFRYELLRDLFDGYQARDALIDDAAAVAVAASLGIKGPDFLSCSPAQFVEGDNIMSIVYAPLDSRIGGKDGAPHAWVAWEDGSEKTWRPAACNAYVRFDLERFWGAPPRAAS